MKRLDNAFGRNKSAYENNLLEKICTFELKPGETPSETCNRLTILKNDFKSSMKEPEQLFDKMFAFFFLRDMIMEPAYNETAKRLQASNLSIDEVISQFRELDHIPTPTQSSGEGRALAARTKCFPHVQGCHHCGHYIPPTYKKCSFNENLVLSKYILTFVWIFTSPHFSIWIFTSPHFSVWIFTSPHFSVWIFTSPHFSIWIFHFASLFHLDFHFAPLLCLDFHFAPLLGLDFPLRLTSPFGFSLRPTSQFGFSTLPHFSVWIFHFAPLLSLDFHFAPLLSLDFPLRPTSQFGFSTSPHFSESRRRT